jgi:hypothetical protein
MTGEEQRIIGGLTAKVENVERHMIKQDEVLAQQNKILSEIHDAFIALKGAWKVLVIISAIIGAVIGWILQFLPFIPHK